MEEFNFLEKLERVKAPPDFEQKVMAQLSLRKREHTRAKYLRLSFAGAFSAIIVLFIVLNVFILPEKSPVEYTALEKGISSPSRGGERLKQRKVIPIIEALDYSGEIQTISHGPPTIYILEQVSEDTNEEIKY